MRCVELGVHRRTLPATSASDVVSSEALPVWCPSKNFVLRRNDLWTCLVQPTVTKLGRDGLKCPFPARIEGVCEVWGAPDNLASDFDV